MYKNISNSFPRLITMVQIMAAMMDDKAIDII